MAKVKENIHTLSQQLIREAKNGQFKPVYLLMGDEPYYPDMVCQAIIAHCIAEEDKDFNETICYGADVTADQIVAEARRYPMMSDRQLVVVKEMQMMSDYEKIAAYCESPLDSTVLVLLMHKAGADKRKSLYKSVQKIGVVLDSPALRDYEIAGWISSYYSSLGLNIEPQAAALLGEHAGTDLSKIAIETDKLRKNLPENATQVRIEDIERNVGISRQFSVFELTKTLSYKQNEKALKIAAGVASDAKFYMPMGISALYTHFSRILRYGALLSEGRYPSQEDKQRALAGVSPYFYKEYDEAVRNYPPKKAMAVIALLCKYDNLSKGGEGTIITEPKELFIELIAKILNS